MHGPNQDLLQGNQPLSHGLPILEPRNDVAPTPVQPEPAARKDPLWPLLAIILALIMIAIWIGVLGWLAVKLLAPLLT